jgi:hypothetical protein
VSRLSFLPIVALLLSTATAAQARNAVVGTWEIVSAKANLNGASRDLFGTRPSGQLVFTKEMRFAVVINDPGVPRFASEERTRGTAEEYRAATAGALALYGTYTVDAGGRFASEHVMGSTFPNWNELDRTTATLTESVEGDRMVEHLHDPGGPAIEILWRRVH